MARCPDLPRPTYHEPAGALPHAPRGPAGSSEEGGCPSQRRFGLDRIRAGPKRSDRRILFLALVLVFGSSLSAQPDIPRITEPAQATESAGVKDGWSVQIAAFLQKEHASSLAETMNRKGYRSFVVDDIVEGRVWHRVRVGRPATQAEAEALRARLKFEECFHDAFVVAHAPRDSNASNHAEPGMKVHLPAGLAPGDKISAEPASTADAAKPVCRWAVQVAAFPTLTESLDFADQLRKKGYTPYLNEAFIRERHWYRVRLGDLETREQADGLLKALRFNEGFRDAYIVAR